MPANLEAGWGIVVQYTTEQWSLPEVHAHLWECLSDKYIANEWNESLDSVWRAEDDTNASLAALAALHNQWAPYGPSELCKVATITNEHKKVEEELLELVAQLEQRCFFGQSCTLDEPLDLEEEHKERTPMDLEVEMQRL